MQNQNRKILSIALASVMALSLTACSKTEAESTPEAATDETAATETAETASVDFSAGLTSDGYYEGVTALDYVELPEDFNAIPLAEEDVAVSDETIDTDMKSLAQQYGTLVELDREAQDGDYVVISYDGTIDGVAFDNGSYKDETVLIGSGYISEDFENSIIGHSAGDTFEASILLSDDYGTIMDTDGNEFDASGKTAVYSITLSSVNEYQLTDEEITAAFEAEDPLDDGTEVTDEATARQWFAENERKNTIYNAISTYLTENSAVSSIPDSVMDSMKETERQYVAYYATMVGYDDADAYMQAAGYDSVDAYLESISESLEESAKDYLIWQAVEESLSVTLTQDDLDKYTSNAYDSAVEYYGEGYVAQYVLRNVAAEMLADSAVIS